MQLNIKMLRQNNAWSVSAMFSFSEAIPAGAIYGQLCFDFSVQFDLNKLCEIEVWRLEQSGH